MKINARRVLRIILVSTIGIVGVLALIQVGVFLLGVYKYGFDEALAEMRDSFEMMRAGGIDPLVSKCIFNKDDELNYEKTIEICTNALKHTDGTRNLHAYHTTAGNMALAFSYRGKAYYNNGYYNRCDRPRISSDGTFVDPTCNTLESMRVDYNKYRMTENALDDRSLSNYKHAMSDLTEAILIIESKGMDGHGWNYLYIDRSAVALEMNKLIYRTGSINHHIIMNNLDIALHDFSRAIKSEEDHSYGFLFSARFDPLPGYYRYRADVHRDRGDCNSAVIDYTRALALEQAWWPPTPRAMSPDLITSLIVHPRAKCYIQLGDHERAKSDLSAEDYARALAEEENRKKFEELKKKLSSVQ